MWLTQARITGLRSRSGSSSGLSLLSQHRHHRMTHGRHKMLYFHAHHIRNNRVFVQVPEAYLPFLGKVSGYNYPLQEACLSQGLHFSGLILLFHLLYQEMAVFQYNLVFFLSQFRSHLKISQSVYCVPLSLYFHFFARKHQLKVI